MSRARLATTAGRLALLSAVGVALSLGPGAPAGAAGGVPPPAAASPDGAGAALPDPLEHGPNRIATTEYDDGDTAFSPPGFPGPVEVRASVHYPRQLDGGPYPLVVLLHGRHATCYSGSDATGGWPCATGLKPIPSYQGYDYLARNLASWGYVVVSVSANGINARDADSSDSGMTARGQLVQLHLDKWQKFATKGGAPFGKRFVGAVDMQNVGTMGHSRGGEGVVRNFQINAELGSPYGIRAVLPLAPVDFGRPVINKVPLSVLLPYCDGDVTDLQGVHFYDDARYNVSSDPAPKYVQEIIGANHNHFNTVWTPGRFPAGTWDDSTCPSFDLTAAQQRDVGEAYMAAFFRMHLGGDERFTPYFDGTDVAPDSVRPAKVHTAYHAPSAQRRDLNRFLDSTALTRNDLGGDVSQQRLTPFDLCGGAPPQPQHCLPVHSWQQPHTVGARPGLSQLRYGWTGGVGRLTNTIPAAARNVSRFEALTFRVARDFVDPRTPDGAVPDFDVAITDGTGDRASVRVTAWSDALFAQPGSGDDLPKLVLTTVRIPLESFEGVDLGKIRKVTFKHNRARSGAILVTDLAFTDRT